VKRIISIFLVVLSLSLLGARCRKDGVEVDKTVQVGSSDQVKKEANKEVEALKEEYSLLTNFSPANQIEYRVDEDDVFISDWYQVPLGQAGPQVVSHYLNQIEELGWEIIESDIIEDEGDITARTINNYILDIDILPEFPEDDFQSEISIYFSKGK